MAMRVLIPGQGSLRWHSHVEDIPSRVSLGLTDMTKRVQLS